MTRSINWSLPALQQLNKSIAYIADQSYQNAFHLKELIMSKVAELSTQAEKHPPDKFKMNNDGSFRAFEIKSFRIAYKIETDVIKIISFRHVKMEPKDY